jgi:hypothetical protein
MSLRTHSKFYYGFEVNADALYLDFDEGGSELTAELPIGSYTLAEFVDAIESALNDAGALPYTVTGNRATRVITIAATGSFTLRVSSGSHASTTAFGLAGFTGSNRTGSASYAGNAAAGTAYSTQFIAQDYIAPENYQNSSYGTVNKSASGRVETVSYGTETFLQMNLKFVTDNTFDGGPIRNNASGVLELQQLMQYLTTKGPLEFIPDEDDTDTFLKVQLESTPDDSKGLKYKLKELYGQGLPGFFETGTLLFRVVE